MNVMVKEHRADPRDEVSRILSTESLSAHPIDIPRFLKADELEDLLAPLRRMSLDTADAGVAPIKPTLDPAIAADMAPEPAAAGTTETELAASVPTVEVVSAEPSASISDEVASEVAEASTTASAAGSDDAVLSPEAVRPHHEEMMRQLRESLARLDDSFVAQRTTADATTATDDAPSEEVVTVETLRNEPGRPASPFPPATHRIRPPAALPKSVFGLDTRRASASVDAPPPPPVLKKPATPIMPPEAPAPAVRAAPPMRKPTLASLFRSAPVPSPAGSKESLHSYIASNARKPVADEVDAPLLDPSAVIVAPVSERTFIPRPVSDPTRAVDGLEAQPVGSAYLGEMFERIRAQEAREAAEIEATAGDEAQPAVEELAEVDPETPDARDAEPSTDGSIEAEDYGANDLNLELLSHRDLEEALIGEHPEMPLAAPAISGAASGSRRRLPIAAPALLLLAGGNIAAIATLPALATEIAYGSSALMTVIAAGLFATRKDDCKDDGDVA